MPRLLMARGVRGILRVVSQDNVEIVRRVVDAFNLRDLAGTTEWFHSGIEWRPGGPAAVERAVYHGLDEVSRALTTTWETWEVFALEESEVRDLGDSSLWLGRSRLRGEASKVEINQEFAVHFLIDGGKVAAMRGFLSWREALASAEG